MEDDTLNTISDDGLARHSLQKMKKDIIKQINSLVVLFNENNKQIKEHNQNRTATNEEAVNDLISKNMKIQ